MDNIPSSYITVRTEIGPSSQGQPGASHTFVSAAGLKADRREVETCIESMKY